MRYHIEHAKYKYEQITVTGWLTGDTAAASTSVWAEDGRGNRIACETERYEREDICRTFFPQEKRCAAGFRIQFPAKEGAAYVLCLSDGVHTVKRKTDSAKLCRWQTIPDSTKEALKMQLSALEKKCEAEEHSPYLSDREAAQRRNIRIHRDDVKFSFVIPAYQTNSEHLADLLASLWNQTYGNWEICIADGSPVSMLDTFRKGEIPNRALAHTLTGYLTDPRVKYRHLPENLGISGNSNAALALAEGEYVVMVDHDDILEVDALEQLVAVIEREPDVDFIYSDSDLTDHDNLYVYNPLYKPVWSQETLYSANYITHLSVIRTSLLRQIGGWRREYDGAQDWDLFLRIGEETDRIVRIPCVLYHWRAAKGSTALAVEEKPYARIAQLRAVQDHLDRRGLAGKAEFVEEGSTCIRIRWTQKTEADVVVVKAPGIRLSPESEAELRAWAAVPGMGVICPRIVDREGHIVSQGLLCKDKEIVPLFAGCVPGTANLWGNTDWYQNHVAAEPFCYAVSRSVWEQVGAPAEELEALAVMDFCLRVENAGYRNLMTPFAEAVAEKSAAAGIQEGSLDRYEKIFEKYQKGSV